MHVRQAIIPAAGLGTRCLPLTKSVPKELLPILGKPAIQYVIEEGIAAGVSEFIIITSNRKQALEHYFAVDAQLETMLTAAGKRSLLAPLDELCQKATFRFVYQEEPRGLGHAIALARSYITDPYFGVLLPDDLVVAEYATVRPEEIRSIVSKERHLEEVIFEPAFAQLVRISDKHDSAVIALKEMAVQELSSYGVVKVENELKEGVVTMLDIIEKPALGQAPSRLAILGRYILPYAIFDLCDALAPAKNGEIQLTDAIVKLIHNNSPLVGYAVSGQWLGTGNPRDLLKANLVMAARDEGFRDLLMDRIAI